MIFSTPGSTRGPAWTQTGPNSGNWSNVDRTANNPLWQQWAQTLQPTPQPTPQQQQQPTGNVSGGNGDTGWHQTRRTGV